MNHHPVKLITNSAFDDRFFFVVRASVCSQRQRARADRSAFGSTDRLSIVIPLCLGAGRPREAGRGRQKPRPPTDVPKLWASNDGRYASFQRHVAYIKISEASVKEWAASGAGTVAPPHRNAAHHRPSSTRVVSSI